MTHDLSLFRNTFIQHLDICEISLQYQCFSLQYPTVAKSSVNINCHENFVADPITNTSSYWLQGFKVLGHVITFTEVLSIILPNILCHF